MIGILAAGVAGAAVANSPATPARGSGFASPIQHVVFILQENHSFDNVLGAWCVQTARCDGATSGNVQGVGTIPLTQAKDKVVQVIHSGEGQTKAIDGGLMDGYSNLQGCTAKVHYKCYSQYQPGQNAIKNVITLANNFAVSDRTFSDGPLASWGMHLGAVAGTMDGFVGGGTPHPGTLGILGNGWGCDSGRDTTWKPVGSNHQSSEPACVPDPALNGTTDPNGNVITNGGAYRPSDVPYVPTIMDSLDDASLTWKLYGGPPGGSNGGQGESSGNSTGYGWATCPTFAECLNKPASQRPSNSQFSTDAAAGQLPNFSLVTPTQTDSQHNGDSMTVGDNWISSTVTAIENSPEWSSTAIFISWDDCGCFYDHVVPPTGQGIRVPMIIVSPYAIPGHTDSNPAQFASVLAFTEWAFGLPPIGTTTWDASAYNYTGSFNFTQAPRKPVKLSQTPVTPAMRQVDLADLNDPT